MNNAIKLLSSGFSMIDKHWGGVYRGGSYVVVGQRKSGRTLLGLQFALESAKSSEVCLYFTNMRPKDLMIQAASLNFDIQSYMNKNLIVVVRVAPPSEISDIHNHDEFLTEYLNDISTVVAQYNPGRIIFDELTPYIGFRNLELLRDVFLHTLENIEDRDVTSLFVIGEPATERASALVETITQVVTGVIYLRKAADEKDQNKVGNVTIRPNVGHTQGAFTEPYYIKPDKGITIFKEDGHSGKTIVEDMEDKDIPDFEENRKSKKEPAFKKVELPKESLTTEPYSFSNVYDYKDFQLILNNQIALFKSTGQKFNIVSFKLDPAAQVNGYLSIKQLRNAVKSSTEKKDKITVVENKVIVLVISSTEEKIYELLSNVPYNLPSDDEKYIEEVQRYIAIYNIEVNENFENCNEMMDFILSADEMPNKYYKPLINYTK